VAETFSLKKEKIMDTTNNIAASYVLIKQSDSLSPCQFSKKILWKVLRIKKKRNKELKKKKRNKKIYQFLQS